MANREIAWEEREREAWQGWSNSPSAASRHALVQHYGPWLRKVARDIFLSFQVAGSELQDYIHYATLGLLEALERFDPAYGVPFLAYAGPRVRGAILNNIPKFCESSHQFSAMRTRWQERFESLENADDISATKDALDEVAEMVIGLAISHLLEDSALFDVEQLPALDHPYSPESVLLLQRDLLAAVDKLDEVEAKVIRFHYFNQLAFKDIATLLNLSQGRISQLHKKAITKLNVLLGECASLDIDL